MKAAVLRLYNHSFTFFRFIHALIRGIDSQIISQHILKIGQAQDMDSIAHRAYQCFNDLFECEFFALALYDSEYNDSVDIWMDPKTDSTAVIEHIKKDFSPESTSISIRSFENPFEMPAVKDKEIKTSRIISVPIMDTQSKARVYILPKRKICSYHKDLFCMISKMIKSAITNFLNMKKLETAALIDPLTNCYNRRAFDRTLEQDIAKAERYGTDVCIIMFDIDHFKQINDSYGHKAGDEILSAFTENIISAIRKSDYLARYGGEEFVLVLPETKLPSALEQAERLRQKIEEMSVIFDNKTIKVTTSAGVAAYKKGVTKNSLLQKADTFLYDAKNQGRNRIKPGLRLCLNHTGSLH